jgi:chromosome segregation ATPase
MVAEEKSSLFEGLTAGVGVVVVLISTLAGPRLNSNMSREELTRDRTRKAERIVALQTWLKTAQQGNDFLRTEVANAGSLLEKARLEIAALVEERDGLEEKVASTAGQLQDVQGKLEELKREVAQFKEFVSLQELAKERDDAQEKAKKAEERIRELTLQLNRAGVWP